MALTITLRTLIGATLCASAMLLSPAQAAETILATSDGEFLKQAVHSSYAEIEASQLALTHAADPKVKAYAAVMDRDHQKVLDELRQLAVRKKVDVDQEASTAQKTEVKLLGVHKGEKFDESYARSYGIKLHQNTILLFRNAIAHVKDAEIKAFAEKTLPSLEHHLALAQRLTR